MGLVGCGVKLLPIEQTIPSETVSTENNSDYEIISLDDKENETESEYSETQLDYAMKVLRGADDLLKSEAIKNINDRALAQQNMQISKSSRVPEGHNRRKKILMITL